MKVCLGNLKGGVGKTTSAVHVALGLSRSGRTLLVDADPQQSTALRWSEMAEDWPVERCVVHPCTTPDLAKRVRPMVADYEHLVLDVGPKNPGLLRQALTLSDHLLVPCRPTSHDIPEVGPTFELAAEMDALNPVTASVLLVDVDTHWRHAEREARELLAVQEWPTMRARVRHLVRYALSRGTAPVEDLGEDYEAVLTELYDEEGSA